MFVTVECPDFPDDDDDNLYFIYNGFCVVCLLCCVVFLFCMYNQKLALLSALISMWKKIIEGPAPKLIRILGGTWDGQSNFLTRDTHMDTPILCYVFAFKSYF